MNLQLLKASLVYPTFYSKLYRDLRETMAAVAVAARDKAAGVWADDATLNGSGCAPGPSSPTTW